MLRNTLLYPPDVNMEYDVLDKNQNLKNFNVLIEEIETLETGSQHSPSTNKGGPFNQSEHQSNYLQKSL